MTTRGEGSAPSADLGFLRATPKKDYRGPDDKPKENPGKKNTHGKII